MGLKQSKVMDHLFQLTDVHGPRLTGSPGFESAGDWAVATLKSWGLQNARKERWAYGTGWSLTAFHATMTAPQTMPIIGLPKAWSTGTKGTVTAEVVRPVITTAEEAAKQSDLLWSNLIAEIRHRCDRIVPPTRAIPILLIGVLTIDHQQSGSPEEVQHRVVVRARG